MAFELLDQFLVPAHARSQHLDGGTVSSGFESGGFAQSGQRVIIGVAIRTSSVVVSRQADARGQHFPADPALEPGEVAKRLELDDRTGPN